MQLSNRIERFDRLRIADGAAGSVQLRFFRATCI